MAQRKHKEPEYQAAVETVSFEQAMEELETIIDRIEQGEIGLDESLKQFRRGDALVRRCRAILDVAEQQVRELAVADGADGPRDAADDSTR